MVKPCCICTGIGSFPHKDPKTVVQLVLNNAPNLPFLPQLSSYNFKENMLIQNTEKIPGAKLSEEKKEVHFLSPEDASKEFETFYENYTGNNLEYFSLSQDRASALNIFLEEIKKREKPIMIKGQVCGPITLGLSLKDKNGMPILYDENFKDVLIKYLGMQARWLEEKFKETLSDVQTLIFFDEPLLSTYGSVSMNLQCEEIQEILNSVSSHLSGPSGIHICGNTDWSMILKTNLKVVHFDAYSYFQNFLLYSEDIKDFLIKDGIIGWGIIPSGVQQDEIEKETEKNLIKKFEQAINILSEKGVKKEIILENSIIAPSCGLGTLSVELAERVMILTKRVSDSLRKICNIK